MSQILSWTNKYLMSASLFSKFYPRMLQNMLFAMSLFQINGSLLAQIVNMYHCKSSDKELYITFKLDLMQVESRRDKSMWTVWVLCLTAILFTFENSCLSRGPLNVARKYWDTASESGQVSLNSRGSMT